ncbi:sensor histidine kinase [Rhodospirillum rubrum]|uniref:histidine kinase n=1 Tax=Rhodospirillum rubrum (strain ATCC 11170 / ATH 1.1.1 / DSM 467 / LMG 4362 / NCIMB 8255 / S1) TaxID=269796 RepID=Q2RR42_RHORT|nr:cache domain-containing protein [Rhodospirillum rubrum]ABC23403.1 Periplasmic Sensor Signal Transduction Histidine Kinase [Rhodospirillum rubrum ATCC 11170]AEO49139.1 periplasmic sensor Signal transduction histidine kinase [Rhodospirillum rubrum F11]MBK5955053.1 two-component sensor histidine kinase [Rhodospirillum rubrum]QXG79375.1 two-component sensor histidine kinase [Rhodospirillum rubrum]HAQ00979.1 two-component sensor histidine kinase [Rhodospirillum rubrum]
MIKVRRDHAPPTRSLIQVLSLTTVGASLIFLLMLSVLWGIGRAQDMAISADILRSSLLIERQQALRGTVERALRVVGGLRAQAERERLDALKAEVIQARSLANHLLNRYGKAPSSPLSASPPRPGAAGAPGLIANALQAFDAGAEDRGLFVLDAAGGSPAGSPPPSAALVAELWALARGGGGYLGSGEGAARRIYYVEAFAPFEWVIGSWRLVEAGEAALQRAALETLAAENGGVGDIFVGTWEGVALLGPGQGRDQRELTDSDGVKPVALLIDQARSGRPGFVEYRAPYGSRVNARKLSYVAAIADWRWYVGTGVMLDDIDALANNRLGVMRTALAWEVLGGIALIGLAGLTITWGLLRVRRRLEASHRRFLAFLDEAAQGRGEIDPAAMEFLEYRDLAASANRMVEQRRDALSRLAERGVELQRSNRELERFAFIASHDLQEPLRSIAGFIQLIERRLGPDIDPEVAEFFSFVVGGAGRMRDQIEGLLEYSRLDRAQLERTVVVLDEVVAEVIAELEPQIAAAGACVRVEVLPVVSADRGQLRLLFTHLLDNALKFRNPDRPPELRISALRDVDGCWRISVGDNGIGIAEAYHAQVFDLFRRLHSAGTYAGTGLGLAVCRRIVERHGGDIRLRSVPGRGTTVSFTLMAPADGPHAAGWNRAH